MDYLYIVGMISTYFLSYAYLIENELMAAQDLPLVAVVSSCLMAWLWPLLLTVITLSFLGKAGIKYSSHIISKIEELFKAVE